MWNIQENNNIIFPFREIIIPRKGSLLRLFVRYNTILFKLNGSLNTNEKTDGKIHFLINFPNTCSLKNDLVNTRRNFSASPLCFLLYLEYLYVSITSCVVNQTIKNSKNICKSLREIDLKFISSLFHFASRTIRYFLLCAGFSFFLEEILLIYQYIVKIFKNFVQQKWDVKTYTEC